MIHDSTEEGMRAGMGTAGLGPTRSRARMTRPSAGSLDRAARSNLRVLEKIRHRLRS